MEANIALVASVPEPGIDVPVTLAREALSGQAIDTTLPREDFQRHQTRTLDLLKKVADEHGATMVYPHEILCNASACLLAKDQIPLYFDDHHLSEHGAMLLAPLFEKILRTD